ncbi:baculoviral IAP repeat-containing protein 2-like [Microplitis mediator]|uniref:baculoviral IAP repeat-containing protein 2-like n=1 Tax=Microplitis mediator TaxID=375433 RepID=UPI002553F6CF|nr:baculoviral IAP repeat-containing protein 2-like [Microplitis mediator]
MAQRLGLILGSATVPRDENPNRIRYASEQSRLESFVGWAGPPELPRKMAAAGLFYLGIGDQVRCHECGSRFGLWEEGEDPAASHYRWQPNCRFIQNIPGIEATLTRPFGPNGYRSSLMQGDHYIIPDVPEPRDPTVVPQSLLLGRLNLSKPRAPMHTEYAVYDRRLESFHDWPTSSPQGKKGLAKAGFWYSGHKD